MGLDIKYTSDKWSYITRILGSAPLKYIYTSLRSIIIHHREKLYNTDGEGRKRGESGEES